MIIIGIDPDIDKSGVIEIISQYPTHSLMMLPLWEVFYLISRWQDYGSNLHIVIEAGWKNKKGMAFSGGRMRAVRTGMNHAIGMQIEAFCEDRKLPYELFVPSDRTPKWDHEMMIKLTGMDVKKSNQEIRDAVRAVYFSGYGREVFK